MRALEEDLVACAAPARSRHERHGSGGNHPGPISIVLVDDHPLVLAGVDRLLGTDAGFDVVASCGSVDEAWEAIAANHPDVVVLDLNLPGENGLALLSRLDPARPPAVVVLTASQDEDLLLDAARLGARGIVLKAMAPRMLEDCIRGVCNGELHLRVNGVNFADRVHERRAVEAELRLQLTPREFEIAQLVALRLDNQQIADRLGISTGTVKIHLHHVYEKLSVDGRQQLLACLRGRGY